MIKDRLKNEANFLASPNSCFVERFVDHVDPLLFLLQVRLFSLLSLSLRCELSFSVLEDLLS